MRARRKTAQDKHTELERSVEQIATRSRHWRRCQIELGEGEMLFAEADALRRESVDRLM